MPSESELRKALESLREEPDRLIEIAVTQAREIEVLRAEIERLRNDNNRFRSRMEEVERAAFRQAAPFRVPEKKRKEKRKRPGRKKGHKGEYRKPPEQVDEKVERHLECCPHCGGAVRQQEKVEQFIEEIPRVRPRVTHLVTYRGVCSVCGEEVASRHPLQVSTATGAAGVHLGPRALAIAAFLNKKQGLSMRKTCKVMEALLGLKLTPGGLSQALDRLAGKLEKDYRAEIEGLRQAPAVYTDETSWWVNGPGHWLWVFTNPHTTIYRVAKGRGRNVVHEVLGPDFLGVLISDCLAVYDDATRFQHKCYSHHLKAISKALGEGHGQDFLPPLRSLLHAAMAFKKIAPGLPPEERDGMRSSLEKTADDLLRESNLAPEAERVRKRLLKQRDHLFTFLDHPAVEATNNLAERQLRPAVIARKISCGNKTPKGAHTWEVLTSLLTTWSQRLHSSIDPLANAARLNPLPP